MNAIEVIVVIILLLMAVPDWCRRWRRPALAYGFYVLFGVVLAPMVDERLKIMMEQAGQIGFIFLLFIVGLEIQLPPWQQLAKAVRFAITWSLFQYPIVLALALLAGLPLGPALMACAALTGCSVGMAYPAWKSFPATDESLKGEVLHALVALEVLTIVALAVATKSLGQQTGWLILLRLSGMAIVIFAVSRFGVHLVPLFKLIIEKTTHWRMHWLVLLIFGVCALGERLGLDSAKTAFFLGLALSRARHHNMPLADLIAPISQRFLIPVFFVSLGLAVRFEMFWQWQALLALGGVGLLLGLRQWMHEHWWRTGLGASAYLLFCPNLTMVALGVKGLQQHPEVSMYAPWLLLMGLFMTLGAVFVLPKQTASSDTSEGSN